MEISLAEVWNAQVARRGEKGETEFKNGSVEFEEHVGCSSGGIQCATGKAGLWCLGGKSGLELENWQPVTSCQFI